MKVSKFVLAAIVVILASANFTFANTSGIAHAAQSNLRDQIEHKIGYPELAKKLQVEGDVNIRFTINSDNRIEVVGITGDDAALIKEVNTALSGQRVETDSAMIGKNYVLKIEFKRV